MRKIIVLEFITLDGVIQAPGGPVEDTSDGFTFGGWVAPYADEVSNQEIKKQLAPADLLLGRKTYDIWADYWPKNAQHWPGINEVTKYVLSNTVTKSDWANTVFLTSVDDIKKLRNSDGANIKLWGSSELVHLLLQHDLVDELWLKIHPILLGKGKKLFGDHATPAAFTLFEQVITPAGVILANYKRSGPVQTGAIGA